MMLTNQEQAEPRSVVYHFTDTGRLPWILHRGSLNPGRNRIGGFPDPDFLWATTSPLGDRTASGAARGYREGLVRLVRFTLEAVDFTPWPAAVRDYPDWTPEHVARLEAFARGKSRPEDWRCRVEPLPRSRWVAIHTRSYSAPAWVPLSIDAPAEWFADETLSVEVAGAVYISREIAGPNGSQGYEVAKGVRTN